jgi:ribosomal protein S18 acetylase RimI-like enzyme
MNSPHSHPLDNVVWSALTSRQSALALGGPRARRFPSEFARFGALAPPSPQAFDELAELVDPGDQIALVTLHDLEPTARFEVLARRDMTQMVAGTPPAHFDGAGLIPLGLSDGPEILALVEKTKPGPFGPRTRELGDFLGVRIDGRLAAMAGERMRLDGVTEISAVCTDPDFRGQGHGRNLVLATCARIRARGETPFLHVFSDNLGALALYEKLGFQVRTGLRLTLLQKPAHAPSGS